MHSDHRTLCCRVWGWTFFFLLLVSGLSMGARAYAGENQAVSGTSGPGHSGSPGGGSISAGEASYTNIKHLGIGLSYAPIQMDPGATTETSVGYVGARYWFNRTFGFDGGLGVGFPEVSPYTALLTTVHLEPMAALLESDRTVLYGNFDAIVGIESGAMSSCALQLSVGIGIEHAMEDMPKLALYGQLDPLSVDLHDPEGGQPIQVGMGLLGSVMNFDIGFRYYF